MIDGFREAGAPDFTRRLIDQFINEACARVRILKEAAGRADAPALKATAHSLKGSSMIMGATRLAALCAQVEDQVALTPGGDVTPALMTEIDEELSACSTRSRSRRKASVNDELAWIVGDALIRAGGRRRPRAGPEANRGSR